jgi:hypothetical protein
MTLPREEASRSELKPEIASCVDHRNPFWILCESRVTLPHTRMLMSVYHPIRYLSSPINVDVTSCFVSMPYMFNDTFVVHL